jgi:DNA-binding MarR family transcriptional regulator
MSRGLKSEIKQAKPFASIEAEAFLSIQRTADLLLRGVAEVLKPHDLSPTQYNALRILRGAGDAGLACAEIGERLINKDPDITRLLDRLEKQELVKRARDKKDRRVVMARISPKGLQILARLDKPISALHQRQLARMGSSNLKQLVAWLEQIRAQGEDRG